jgi:hypothetical protein
MLASISSIQQNSRQTVAAMIGVAVALAAPLSACGSTTVARESGAMDNGREKAIAAGRDFVRQRFPDFVEDRKTPIVTEKGETWEFTYRLPDDMLGGAPVVILNKADLSVREFYRTQ